MFVKDEELKTVEPTAKYCKKCQYALKDFKYKDTVIVKSGYASCDKYEEKPHDVLWDGAECPLFKEKEEESE